MDIRPHNLQDAVDRGIINPQQAEALWQLWQTQNHHVPQFRMSHVLYYLGGLIAIGAMSLFMNLGWEHFDGGAIVALCVVYGIAALALTEYFGRKNLLIPAGLTAAFVVVLVPLAVYGAQQALGLWPDDWHYRDYHRWADWRWVMMELATLAAAALMLWRYRYPFLMLPLAVTLWYVSMDVAEWWLLADTGFAFMEFKYRVSVAFGLAMLALAVWIDFRNHSRRDYPFWLYIFGTLTFWCGLSLLDSDSELAKFVYFLINVALVFAGVLLRRRVFTVFGAMGMFGYGWHLADKIFQDSWLFPIALTLLGLVMVGIGVWWQKNEARLNRQLRQTMPKPIREFLERKVV